MATQFATAYSAKIMGAGIVAGGPYYCAGQGAGVASYLDIATSRCMQGIPAPSGNRAYQWAKQFAGQGLIDPVAHLSRQRIYVFAGSQDSIVHPAVTEQTADFYRTAQTQTLRSSIGEIPAGHALLTGNAEDLPCAANAFPNLNNCGSYQAHDILNLIYPGLTTPANRADGILRPFDQREFASSDSGLDDNGHVFIPNGCEQGSCRLHVVFHGCTQTRAEMGDRFYRSTGYNELAANNRIVVLYPRIKADPVRNPKGCWDFWGYSSADPNRPDFYTKQAPQMRAIHAMLQKLEAKP